MSKTKKSPAGLARLAGGVLAIAIAVPTLTFGAWDGQSWVYTAETHTTTPPNTADVTIEGLDAKARGLDATFGDTTIDKWFWTSDYSNDCELRFSSPGMLIIFR